MSNRVEELESQVAKLQAAVDGLTEELVETRERLRALEAEDGVDNTRTPDRRESADSEADDASEATSDADAAGEDDADARPDADAEAEDDSDSDGNDIIVA